MSLEDEFAETLVRHWKEMPRICQIALELEAVELFPEDFDSPEDRKEMAKLRLELAELEAKESTKGAKS